MSALSILRVHLHGTPCHANHVAHFNISALGRLGCEFWCFTGYKQADNKPEQPQNRAENLDNKHFDESRIKRLAGGS